MKELLDSIEKINFKKSKISNVKSLKQADKIAFSLFSQSSLLIDYLVSYYTTDSSGKKIVFNKIEAVIAGLLVRLDKFQLKALNAYTLADLELLSIICRIIAETGINLVYIIQEQSDELFDKFVSYSHKTLLKTKKRHKEIPNGLKFKEVAEKHIKTSFEETELTDEVIETLSKKDWAGSIYDRANACGFENVYEILFRHTNHAIHGNWEDLATFHLTRKKNGYVICPDEISPSFEILAGMTTLNLQIIDRLIDNFITDDTAVEILKKANYEIEKKTKLLFIRTNFKNTEC